MSKPYTFGRFDPLVFFCCLPLMASGCSAYKPVEVQELENAIPPAYAVSSSEGPVEERAPHEWWEQFEDSTLETLMDDVLERNLGIRRSLARLAQLQAIEKEQSASLWPSLSITGSVDRGRRNTSAFSRSFTGSGDALMEGGNNAVTTSTYRASVPLRWELDIWGKLRATAEAAEQDVLAGEENTRALSASVAAQTVEAYYRAIQLCEQIQLLEKTIDADTSFTEIVSQRYRDGVADPLDVYQAQQNLSSRRAERPEFEFLFAQQLTAISVLKGEYPDPKALCKGQTLPTSIPRIPPGIPADLLTSRPDVHASFLSLQAADRRLAAAFRDRLPSLVITGSGGYEDLEIDNLFRPETLVWRLVAEASQTVFDGGAKAAREEFREAAADEQGAAYAETVITAFKEVEDALRGETLLREQVTLIENKVRAARRTLRLSTEQYIQGLSNYLPVLDAQRTYYFAQTEMLAIRRALISNHVQLARALGGGWDSSVLAKRFEDRKKMQVDEEAENELS